VLHLELIISRMVVVIDESELSSNVSSMAREQYGPGLLKLAKSLVLCEVICM